MPTGNRPGSGAGPRCHRLANRQLSSSGLPRLAGHADVRWHLWIVLAAVGRLDLALVVYAVYFPLRTLAGGLRKGVAYA